MDTLITETEPRYAFRKALSCVHTPGRREKDAKKGKNEIEIDESWCILLPEEYDEILDMASRDLQEYFHISMGIFLPLRKGKNFAKSIAFTVEKKSKKTPRSYVVEVKEDSVLILGASSEGARQGGYFLEDCMNLAGGPFLKKGKKEYKSIFSPRMIHSGWGLDQFPDAHLSAMAHAGFDHILLFVKAPGMTTHGYMDFDDLISRCEKYGLGVYFYSYLPSFKSPDDADADAFFENSYGSVFKACPKAKGIILVGESCFFPSKDERTNGQNRIEVHTGKANDGLGDHRPEPGSFPCSDYPKWLEAVKKAIHRYAPHADIVFWTYNWGSAPEDARRSLIKNLPEGISLEVTFEVFEKMNYEKYQTVITDYTISFPGPSRCFISEAEEASKRSLPLYTMSNTAGRTWDFGMVPYVPTAYLWLERFAEMKKANKKWGLSGVMDSHHYGWYPSFITECAKWAFREPREAPMEEILAMLAARIYGKKAAKKVLKAWEFWSRAMRLYTPGPDDMSGPLRTGPAYPFILQPILYPCAQQHMKYPTLPQSPVGAAWFNVFYQPEHVKSMTSCGRRLPEEIKILQNVLALWEKGNEEMRKALKNTPEEKYLSASKEAGIGFFCGNTLRTLLHIKEWFILNKKLEVEYDLDKASLLVDELEKIVEKEYENVENTIPLTEKDSRLGWEPSMDYICDAWHLNWKKRQLEQLKKYILPAYRNTLQEKF